MHLKGRCDYPFACTHTHMHTHTVNRELECMWMNERENSLSLFSLGPPPPPQPISKCICVLTYPYLHFRMRNSCIFVSKVFWPLCLHTKMICVRTDAVCHKVQQLVCLKSVVVNCEAANWLIFFFFLMGGWGWSSLYKVGRSVILYFD